MEWRKSGLPVEHPAVGPPMVRHLRQLTAQPQPVLTVYTVPRPAHALTHYERTPEARGETLLEAAIANKLLSSVDVCSPSRRTSTTCGTCQMAGRAGRQAGRAVAN